MWRLVSTRKWTFAIYLQKHSRLRRINTLGASIIPNEVSTLPKPLQPSRLKVDHANVGAKKDEAVLQEIFDSPELWEQFSRSSLVGPNHGLFQNRYLTKPQGFEEFANVCLQKAQKIVTKVLAASTTEQYLSIVKDLDRLSDLLCRVIDLSEFVRSTHPESEMQYAASKAHSMMFEYMNILNTTRGLASQLDIAIKSPSISGNWDEQETLVARILKKDFDKSAINLPQSERKRFVSLSQDICEIGQDFVEQMAPKLNHLSFSSNKLKGMDPTLVKKFTSWGQVKLPVTGQVSSAVLQTVQDEDVREKIFIASRTSAPETIERLHLLLRRRAELARLTNFESYAHMNMEGKMAKSPELVIAFLKALSKKNRSLINSELDQILVAKKLMTQTNETSLQPWDKEYYMFQLQSAVRTKQKRVDFLSSFFSLGRVMQGLSRLFSRLYGIRLVPHETSSGETWHSDVRRLDVISETDGHVAVLYCDLFSRPGKSNNPAHFTIQCSRHIRKCEIEEAAASESSLFENAVTAVSDGMATAFSPLGELMQLPIIGLICDFTPNTTSRPTLLSFSQLTTLFHEMGHAIHSALGRTTFQNVSGTRCPTDFAELPSVLMEHFAADPQVIGLFAEHYETGEKLNYAMVEEKLQINSKFEGLDTENQITLAMLDQAYHSSLPLDSNFDSSKVYLDIQKKNGALPPDPEGTSWQGFFGHLFGYGSMYYSYLFDRVLAKRVWTNVFNNGEASISRENGERYKKEVLQWGGSRDPWRCLSNVLEDERLEGEGEKVMSLVGSWGIEDGKKQ
ncbi:Mitochondrial intermediate peptidase [Golovinomyces cichoracearum]|uniref:Mitochondrial intermediate peptidase n=1 Tax=Golovinomyces cichoracearum TaxID=62708 RepID=A0A420HUS5_9PEZI|nr:Mitochondrial intermediate peptidase [Golovinomyces cichoracearum]